MASLPQDRAGSLPAGTTVAGLTFIPTIETTVVTTTRTTTTSLPQVVLKPQIPLSDRDPKVYPLASSRTPAHLREFIFDLNGTATLFKEAEDSPMALRELDEVNAVLERAGGLVQSTARHPTYNSFDPLEKPTCEPPAARRSRAVLNTGYQHDSLQSYMNHDLRSPQRRKRKRTEYRQADLSAASVQEMSRGCSPSLLPTHQLPRTPDRSSHTPVPPLIPSLGHRLSFDTRARQSSIRNFTPTNHYSQSAGPRHQQLDAFETSNEGVIPAFTSHETVLPPVATPPIDMHDVVGYDEIAAHPITAQRYRRGLSLVGIGEPEPGLPSPTLSPTLGPRTDSPRGSRRASNSEKSLASVDSRHSNSTADGHSLKAAQPYTELALPHESGAEPVAASSAVQTLTTSSLPDFAAMVSAFENMDIKLQDYLLCQLLRRSRKETIKTVAAVCDPALRIDFIKLLPQELRISIIRYLDVKTLCRAAQVSKQWRQIIDTAEHLWKKALAADDMAVTDAELWKAIREGWGWQSPYGPEGAEINIVPLKKEASNVEESVMQPTDSNSQIMTRAMQRNRRLSGRSNLTTRSRKPTRRGPNQRAERLIMSYQAVRDSPQAAREAALNHIPSPSCGLPSIQEMHLYKSIYRRQHQLRHSWFDTRVRSQHLAFRAHSNKVVTCLQFDADKIVSGSDDHFINVYDTQTGALRNTLEGHDGGVWAFEYIGNVLVSGSTDRTVRLWDLDRGVCTHILEGHTSTVRCLQVLDPVQVGVDANGEPIMQPPERLIISGSRDSSLRIWKFPVDGDFAAPTGEIIRGEAAAAAYWRGTLNGHHHSVRAIHAYGDRVVSGSYDTNVCVWRISTRERLHRLSGHINKVYSVVLDHQRDRVISGAMDNSIKIWSLETGAVIHNLEGHSSLVGLLSLDHDCLVSAAADSTLRIWEPETGQCRMVLAAHTGAITCFQHDKRKLVSGSDKNLKVWDITTGKVVSNILTDLTGVWQCRFDDRRCVAAVSRNGQTYIEVVDFGAVRDGVPAYQRGRRIVVNQVGQEIQETFEPVEAVEIDAMAFHAMATHAADDGED